MQVAIEGYLHHYSSVLSAEMRAAILAFLTALHMVAEATDIAAGVPALVDRPPITVHGRVCRQQRSVGFFAPDGVSGYRYSRQMAPRQDVPPVLSELLDFVNSLLGTRLNAVLVNYYENGTQYISAHKDSSWGLVPGQPIVGLSFGATRTFRIREAAGNKIRLDLPLEDNSMVVMLSQTGFTHEIPGRKRLLGERWSLTLRAHQ